MNKIFLVHLNMGILIRKPSFIPKNLAINTLISHILGIYAEIHTLIPKNAHKNTFFWVYKQISSSIYPITIHYIKFFTLSATNSI